MRRSVDVRISGACAFAEVARMADCAADAGFRSVRTTADRAAALRPALRERGCLVGTACSGTVGFLGASMLSSVGEALGAGAVDELDISADIGALAEDRMAVRTLRHVVALCHAKGALANTALAISGAPVARLRAAVRAARAASGEFVTLAVPAADRSLEIALAAAIDEARGFPHVRVACGHIDRRAAARLLSLGASTVEAGIEALSW